jgi:hypothetical protein
MLWTNPLGFDKSAWKADLDSRRPRERAGHGWPESIPPLNAMINPADAARPARLASPILA